MLMVRKLVEGCFAILAVLLNPYSGLLGQVIPNGGGPRGFSGVSALYLSGQTSAASGVPKIDSATLSNPNVDGISVAVYWRDFYTNENDPKSPIDWTGVDAVFAQAAAAGKYVRLIIPPGFYSPAWVLQSVPVLKLPVAEGPLADG